MFAGNVALSEKCCSTILELYKPWAMLGCQAIPGNKICGAICAALLFVPEGQCNKACDEIQESVHCENAVSGKEGNSKGLYSLIALLTY